MGVPDEYADLTFPLAGLDLSAEYGGQAPLTTPEGENVRAFEPDSYRARGGSRPGISRYVSTQVSGTNLIQHLAVIVDPTPRGLPAFTATAPTAPLDGSVDLGGGLVGDPTEGASPPVPPSPPTTDPSTNNGPIPRNNGNREPRDGGSGYQPNRNLPPPPPPPPPPPGFVQTQQSFDEVFSGTSHDYPTTFDDDVTLGNLILAFVKLDYSGHGGVNGVPAVTLSDDQGGTWNLAESLDDTSFVAHYYLYYAVAANTGPTTVTVHVSSSGSGVTSPSGTVIVMEYRGYNRITPLDAHVSDRGTITSQSSGSFGPGTLTPAASDELLVAFFHSGILGSSNVTVSEPDTPDFAVRTFINTFSSTHIGYVADSVDATASGIGGTLTPALSWSTISGLPASSIWVAIGASFRMG